MASAKADAIEVLSKLSDEADMDEILYRMYVLKKVREGRESAASEPTLSTEETRREVETW